MNDAFIEYKGVGFWINESFIEVLSYYICQEFEKKSTEEYSKSLQEMYDVFEGNRSGVFIGMVDIPFDMYISKEEDREAMVEVFEETKLTLQSKGEKIEVNELNQIESGKNHEDFRSIWKKPVYTSSLIATLDIMIKMLKGEWTIKNHAVYFKGFSAPSGVELV